MVSAEPLADTARYDNLRADAEDSV